MANKLTNNQILLQECIKQEFEENDTYDDISTYFEFFAASQVLKDFNLSDEEIDNGNSGGGNDGGCDNFPSLSLSRRKIRRKSLILLTFI